MSVARDTFTKSSQFTSSKPLGTVSYRGVTMALVEEAHDARLPSRIKGRSSVEST